MKMKPLLTLFIGMMLFVGTASAQIESVTENDCDCTHLQVDDQGVTQDINVTAELAEEIVFVAEDSSPPSNDIGENKAIRINSGTDLKDVRQLDFGEISNYNKDNSTETILLKHANKRLVGGADRTLSVNDKVS